MLIEIGVGIAAFEKSDFVLGTVEETLYEALDSVKNDDTLVAPWDKLQNDVRFSIP